MRKLLLFLIVSFEICQAYAQTCEAPVAGSVDICAGSSAVLIASGQNGEYQWYDALSEGTLLFTGTTFTTPALDNTTTYYVQLVTPDCTSSRTAVTAQVRPSPFISNQSVCSGSAATLTANGPGGTYEWFDSPSAGNLLQAGPVFRTPVLTSTITYYVQTTVNGCVSPRSSVTVFVNPIPESPTVSNVTVCSGSSPTLTATGPGGLYQWFDTAVGGNSLIISPDFTTPVLTATTTFYVQTTLNGCTSIRKAVTIIVNPIPAPPSSAGQTICSGMNATLSASSSTGVLTWYDVPARGTPLSVGSTFTTPALTRSTTYYVTTTENGCTSARTPVTVVVNRIPDPPTVSGTTICVGSTATLEASGGTSYEWYDAAAGGSLLASAASYTTPSLNENTTFFVQTTINGCASGRTAVLVSVAPVPAIPVSSGITICAGNNAILSAGGSTGIYEWYDSPTGGTLLIANPQYTTPILTTTTTFYVQSNSGGCVTSRVPVSVTVNPVPAAPLVPNTSVCQNSPATLIASGQAGTFEWYDAGSGGNLLFTGATFTTPPMSAGASYYVQAILNNCISTRTEVIVSVIPVPNPRFGYSSGTYCTGGDDPVPVIFTPGGGRFSASPAGLIFKSTATGEIDLAASALGSYTVTFTSNGPCPSTSTNTVNISNNTNAEFSFEGPYCKNGVNPAPTYPSGGSGGILTISPRGLVFVAGQDKIDLSASLPGTYTITNTIPGGTSCPAVSFTDEVTILPAPLADAGPDQAATFGTRITLAGTSQNATSLEWSGGLGTFSSPTTSSTTYTPAPNELNATLFLRATGDAICAVAEDVINVTFNLLAPTAAGLTICSANTGTLVATAPGGTIEWFDKATGGNLLLRNPTFVTPPLTATTTYYVQAAIGDNSSPRTAVTVTVEQTPPLPVVSGITVCGQNTVTLSVTSAVANYQWYDDPVAGNLVSSGASFTTPVLNRTITYYVLAIAGSCSTARVPVTVTVNPAPDITSAARTVICNLTSPDYTITADFPGTTFVWSRAAVAGLSNTALANQTSSVISETLVTTAISPVTVTYVITPTLNGCPGEPFNYVVTVDPTSVVTSAATGAICNNSASNYTVTFNLPGTAFNWSRAAVNGISNRAIAGQTSGTIREILNNTTNTPIRVTYAFNHSFAGCAGPVFNYVVTVNPVPQIVSSNSGSICNNIPHQYTILSNVQGATFNWSREAVPGITNDALNNQKSATINETLVNTTLSPVTVIYSITATADGCSSSVFYYRLVVNPTPAVPVIKTNSPVCVNNRITLSTAQIQDATYMWTGPNGFTSPSRTPLISNVSEANEGTYSLVITINGCPSEAGTTEILVNDLPVSQAGPDQSVCINTSSVNLAGKISGGTSRGIWSSSGTGTFSPSSTTLNAVYLPSAADKISKSIKLTLTSASPDDCTPAVSSMNITFDEIPVVNAGIDMDLCIQTPNVRLNGTVSITSSGIWTSSGNGIFTPANTALNATYIPSSADLLKGNVVLTLNASGTNTCLPSLDGLIVRFLPPPIVNAGLDFLLPVGRTASLDPKVNEKDVTYLWTPNINLSDNTIRNPIITGVTDQTYTLTVIDSRGCITQDQIFVDVLMPIITYNTFTPNGDGVNDTWNIPELNTYPQNTVLVFNRYGEKIFSSVGYDKPWDGTYRGISAPAGTYYYIINTKFPGLVYSGYVAILR